MCQREAYPRHNPREAAGREGLRQDHSTDEEQSGDGSAAMQGRGWRGLAAKCRVRQAAASPVAPWLRGMKGVVVPCHGQTER